MSDEVVPCPNPNCSEGMVTDGELDGEGGVIWAECSACGGLSTTGSRLDEAVELLRWWIADYDNEAWPYPAKETREFLGMPPSDGDFG